MFIGFVDLEATLVGSLLVVNSSDTPLNADAVPTFRVYGPDGFVEAGSTTAKDSGSITGATNATPIVITSANHGLTTGARITVVNVLGNTAANGTFIVTRVDANTFSLDGSAGNGAYTSGGTWNVTGLYEFEIDALGASGYENGESYQVLFDYNISSGTVQGQLMSFHVT